MYTYFIRLVDTEYVKIGIATNPYSRLATLQTANPHPLEIIGLKPGDRETWFHSLFRKQHFRGEWFRFEGDLKEYFDLNKNELLRTAQTARDEIREKKATELRKRIRSQSAVLSRLSKKQEAAAT